MGTPVIAGNAGAAPETVLAPPFVAESLRTGFLVKPDDASALAVAIAHVLSFGASASGKLSSRARKHVEARFSTEHMCAETLDAYAALRRGSEDDLETEAFAAVRGRRPGGVVISQTAEMISLLTSCRNQPMFRPGPAIVAKTALAIRASAGFDLSTQGE